MHGAMVEEVIIADNLASKQAYELEYRHLEKMVYEGKRNRLWNTIPPSICTSQEHEAYVRKLTENLTSKDRLNAMYCSHAANQAWEGLSDKLQAAANVSDEQ